MHHRLRLKVPEPLLSWESLETEAEDACCLPEAPFHSAQGSVFDQPSGAVADAVTDTVNVGAEKDGGSVPSEKPVGDADAGVQRFNRTISGDKFQISVLAFNRYGRLLDEAILISELARHLQMSGLDTKPKWAHAGKVLFPTRACALPVNIQLRPYHVLLKTEDIPSIDEALASLPYKQRPRLQTSENVSLDFVVEKTFIVVADPGDSLAITPRSTLTVSTGAVQKGYKNPRASEWAGCTFDSSTDAVSQSDPPHVPKTLAEHIADLKLQQSRSDYVQALQTFSNIKRDGLQPDTQAFSIIIEMCGKAGTYAEDDRKASYAQLGHVRKKAS